MAIFGAPVAHGDEPARAVRAADAIQRAMPDVGAPFGRTLAAHVGIAAGEVVASGVGAGAHRAYTVIGPSVNLASRLVGVAGPGEIVLDGAVHDAVAREATCTPIDALADSRSRPPGHGLAARCARRGRRRRGGAAVRRARRRARAACRTAPRLRDRKRRNDRARARRPGHRQVTARRGARAIGEDGGFRLSHRSRARLRHGEGQRPRPRHRGLARRSCADLELRRTRARSGRGHRRRHRRARRAALPRRLARRPAAGGRPRTLHSDGQCGAPPCTLRSPGPARRRRRRHGAGVDHSRRPALGGRRDLGLRGGARARDDGDASAVRADLARRRRPACRRLPRVARRHAARDARSRPLVRRRRRDARGRARGDFGTACAEVRRARRRQSAVPGAIAAHRRGERGPAAGVVGEPRAGPCRSPPRP